MSERCEALVGGGCLGSRAEVACEDTAAGDTGCRDCGEAWVGGGGAGCTVAPGAPGALLLLLLLFFARAALAVDVEHLEVGDGGPVPGVVDPASAAPWTPRVAVGGSHAGQPVRVRTGDQLAPLVIGLDTLELAASLQISDAFRAGVAVPIHRVAVIGEPPASGVGDVRGFLVVPLGEGVAAIAALELPAPDGPVFTRQLSTVFGAAARQDLGPFTLAGHLRARLQEPTDLPGVRWGHRLELAAGLRTRGRAGVGAVALVGAPLGLLLAPPDGAWPVEGLGFASIALVPGVTLDAGAGAGLTYGLGAPSMRAFAALRVEHAQGDRDADGIGDLRDLCDRRAEDRDDFRDRDGCPEEDNDGDGFADVDDECPIEPEVVNGLDDEDGCPDRLAAWRIVVEAEREVEQLRIAVDGDGGWQLDPAREVVVPPGAHHLVVEAPGHRTFDQVLDVPPGPSELEVHLRALRLGELRIALLDPHGRPLAGRVVLGDEVVEVPAGGTTATLASGERVGTASAPGHLPETLWARVPPGGSAAVEVVLEPQPEHATPPPVLFAVDSAALAPDAVALLDALAAWLAAHPEVHLLRIEGHADALGSPAYNHALSIRRAHAVRDALVARGIAADRLEAIGSGEARAHLVPEALPPSFLAEVAGVPARDVTFRVLVWDEDALGLPGAADATAPGP